MATLLEFFNIDIELLGKIGIYSIHHIHNPQNIYVGSTTLIKRDNRKTHHGFYKRFYDHTRSLNNNTHHSKYLQRVVNKYGINGLVFKILEICDESMTIDQIRKKEQYYIDLLKPVYNSFDTIYPKGRLWTKEDREKAKLIRKGKSFPKEVYERIQKPIYQLDMKGNLIMKYSSKAKAAKILKIDPSSMSNCALRKRKSAGGYKWTYDHPNDAKAMGFSDERLTTIKKSDYDKPQDETEVL
jgi:hypothetical protein